MANILSIESSTAVCSISLGVNGKVVALKEDNNRNHASVLAPFIKDIFDENDLSIKDIDAVAISSGPGSYTGLRIGAAIAKALAYSLNKPLIAIDTLKAIANIVIEQHINSVGCNSYNQDTLIVPMIDARRDEVYSASFNLKLKKLSQTEAIIITPNYFDELLKKHNIILCGDGANKSYDILKRDSSNASLINSNISLLEVNSSATGMVSIAEKLFNESVFVDVAYWEPFYLKNFVAIKSKKILL